MQACGLITLLAIVAAVMSIICWLKSSPLPVGDASISAANKDVEKQMRSTTRREEPRFSYYHPISMFC